MNRVLTIEGMGGGLLAMAAVAMFRYRASDELRLRDGLVPVREKRPDPAPVEIGDTRQQRRQAARRAAKKGIQR